MASRFVGEFVDLYLPVNCLHIDPNIQTVKENANLI